MLRTAWAVVPLPAKLSRTIEFLSVACSRIYSIIPVGLGVLKAPFPKILLISKVPVSAENSEPFQKDFGLILFSAVM